jgi:hypothetical protein
MVSCRCSAGKTAEGGMARHRASTQRDLFGMTEPAAVLPPETVKPLLPLLQQLLLEAIMAETTVTEGSDEQDHS